MTVEIRIRAGKTHQEVLSDWLAAQGSMGVVIDISQGQETPTIKGYVEDSDLEAWILHLQLLLVARGESFDKLDIEWNTLEDENWQESWKKHTQPVATGRQLLVLPHWWQKDPNETRQIIRLDPEMAFGSGAHETTRACLEALEKIADNGGIGRLLDMGTGSGILAIGAVLLGAHHVVAVDCDPVAVETARKNSRSNAVDDKITFLQADTPPEGPFSTVVANILANILIEIRTKLIAVLAPGGRLVLSGILTEQANEVTDAYTQEGMMIKDVLPMGEWTTLTLCKTEQNP